MNEKIIISVLIFLGLVFLVLSCYLHLHARGKKKEILDKVNMYSDSEDIKEVNWASAEPSVQQFFASLATKLARFTKPRDEENLGHRRKKMIMAGYRRNGDLVLFYGGKVLFAAMFPAIIFTVHIFSGNFAERLTLIGILVLGGLVGYFGPNMWVDMVIAKRQEKIRQGFPDALDLLVVCVEAGMGLDQAIKRISDEMKMSNKIISDEFGLMSLEMRAGRSRQDSMRNLGTRTGVDDVKNLAALLIQTDKFGTSIAHALRVHAGSMRTKRRQKGEELAAKLPVKMLFPLILFIFPSLFVIVIGPGAIRIYRALIQTNFGGG